MYRWLSRPKEEAVISFHVNRILVSVDAEEGSGYGLPRVETGVVERMRWWIDGWNQMGGCLGVYWSGDLLGGDNDICIIMNGQFYQYDTLGILRKVNLNQNRCKQKKQKHCGDEIMK